MWILLFLPVHPPYTPCYQVSVRQATISLSLLLACTSRCKPWDSLWGSSATAPLVDFHHKLTARPSYIKMGIHVNMPFNHTTLNVLCSITTPPSKKAPASILLLTGTVITLFYSNRKIATITNKFCARHSLTSWITQEQNALRHLFRL